MQNPGLLNSWKAKRATLSANPQVRSFHLHPTNEVLFNGTDKLYPCFQLTAKLGLGKNGLLALLRAEGALEIGQGQMSSIIITIK